jgi:CyaY protein
MMDEAKFDKIADEELRYLERTLGDFDPDELEVDLASGVLTLTLADGGKIVVNSHRAAGQIWMAGFRTAWHFSPVEQGGGYAWRTATEELRSALARVLSQHLKRAIQI